MHTIRIEWEHDYYECDDCGGSYADGAKVYIDGEMFLDLTPSAYCFDSTHYTEEQVYRLILEKLGHTVESDR